MTLDEGILEILASAGGPLHWTVIQDRALRAGHLDPFTTPDVRAAVQAALRSLVAEGRVTKVAKGSYLLA